MDYTMLAAPAGHLAMPSLLPGFVQDEVGSPTCSPTTSTAS
ncbi:hypothetical protein [Ellagibacter isourolithinifaciens]